MRLQEFVRDMRFRKGIAKVTFILASYCGGFLAYAKGFGGLGIFWLFKGLFLVPFFFDSFSIVCFYSIFSYFLIGVGVI
jgi:hypothetical protein